MPVILVRDNEMICDNCILDSSDCDSIVTILEDTAVGEITHCDNFKTKEMMSDDRLY